jgi:hypothetical protein
VKLNTIQNRHFKRSGTFLHVSRLDPNNGAIVRDRDRLAVGAELSIQFGRGQAKVSVVEIDNGKEEN